jgi:hypothetical protein
MLAQLIVNEIVLVETAPVKKDIKCALWKMEVDREM